MAGPRFGVASQVRGTSTFSPKPTAQEDCTILVGEDGSLSLAGTNTEFAGAVSGVEELGAGVAPLLAGSIFDADAALIEVARRRIGRMC